jgi:hypothetical protein
LKNKYKGKKDDSSDDDDEKKKNKPYKKKDGKKKEYHKNENLARLILLVIGSQTLNHQVAYPMVKVTMRRRRWPHL